MTYDEIEALYASVELTDSVYPALERFVEYRQKYERGETDPISGLHTLDRLRDEASEAVRVRARQAVGTEII